MMTAHRSLGLHAAMQRLPLGKPKQCHETDGLEIAKTYEKVFELERRLTLLESRRILVRLREPKRDLDGRRDEPVGEDRQ